MLMTRLGKLFVFATLVLSLLFAGGALGLYTNRINWVSKEGGGEAAKSELAKRQEIIKDLKESVDRGRVRLFGAQAGLQNAEKARPALHKWYANRLNEMKTGNDLSGAPAQSPVRPLKYQNGALQLEPGARYPRPLFDPPLALPPVQKLLEEIKNTEDKIAQEIVDINKKIREQEILTNAIKAIRVLLAEEDEAWKRSLKEVEYIKPFLYDEEGKAALLQKRQRSLDARIQELTGQGVASSKPATVPER